MSQRFLLCAFLALGWLACGGGGDGGGGGGDPTSPPPPTAMGSFRLSGAGYDQTHNWNRGAGNLVFCRRNGPLLWVRLAADQAADGDNSPHIDIDACNYTSGGTFLPMNPGGCPGGPTFDIFWHDGPAIFVNTAASSPCQLTLTVQGSMYQGQFSCSQLPERGGNRNLAVLDGSFLCTLQG